MQNLGHRGQAVLQKARLHCNRHSGTSPGIPVSHTSSTQPAGHCPGVSPATLPDTQSVCAEQLDLGPLLAKIFFLKLHLLRS